MTNLPNAREWPVEDLIRATSLVKELGNLLSSDVLATLLHGERPEAWIMEGDALAHWREEIANLDPITRTRFVSTIEVYVAVSGVVADGLQRMIVDEFKSTLPDPDTVSIPDTVPDDWEAS